MIGLFPRVGLAPLIQIIEISIFFRISFEYYKFVKYENPLTLNREKGKNSVKMKLLTAYGSFFLDNPNRRTKLRATDLRYRQTVF